MSKNKRYKLSVAEHAKAKKLMPGGVNSPVRAYSSVGMEPVTIQSGAGCQVTDIDGNEYIDYVGSYGPLILGHAHPAVVEAIQKTAQDGMSFGMPTKLETQLAGMVIDRVPSVEVVRFVNSGTEAVMSAIRLARGFTGKSKIVKCIGGYHGHMDGLLVQAGSGLTTLGSPSSPGVTPSTAADTLLMPYNDVHAAELLFREHGNDIAAVIIEPIAGNMGCIPPAEGYLKALRELCDGDQTLLIFDEVMTGFRVHPQCAQGLYGITPDLTTLGKVVGGGMPCAAYGGRTDIMRRIAPDGPVYQAGTLSGNPLAMAAGIATLSQLTPAFYTQLEAVSNQLERGLSSSAAESGQAITINRVSSMLTIFFHNEPVTDYAGATSCNTEAFALFFRKMLDCGVVLPPSQFEAWFVSGAHDEAAIQLTLGAARTAFESL